jgi:hypothetical protein
MMKHSIGTRLKAALLSAAALTAFVLPATAQAQGIPSYAKGSASGDETIQGRIASVDSKDHITVHDERGFIDDVSLHNGTVINPTGLPLAAGQLVRIYGHAAGSTFAAVEIDTRYGDAANAPDYPYYPYAYYPYPYWGYGWGWGWGIGVGFGFRGGGFGFHGRFR